MFESAEIGHRIDKATYREAVPALRAALQQAQVALHEKKKFPVVSMV